MEELLNNFNLKYVPVEDYEYVGFCSSFHMKDPPNVLDDEWLLDHGWFKYVDYWSGDMRWLAPPDNDSQSGSGDIFGADPDMEEAKRWMKYYAVWEPQRG